VLGAARERITRDFRDAYTTLTRGVVIPGAKEKHVTPLAKVIAAAPVSTTANPRRRNIVRQPNGDRR
jgi:Mce-associated membrane protein